MDLAAGAALIATGSLLGMLVVFGLWERTNVGVAVGALAACGALVGTGGLLVQDRAGVGDWALTLVVLGVLAPAHALFVFGRPGRPGRSG